MDALFDEVREVANQLAEQNSQNPSAVHFFRAILNYAQAQEFLIEHDFADLDNATKELIGRLPTTSDRESAQIDMMRSNVTNGYYYTEFMEERNIDTSVFDPVVMLYASACAILEMNIYEVHSDTKLMERISELLTTIEKTHEVQPPQQPENAPFIVNIHAEFYHQPTESEVKERMLGFSDIINSVLAKGGTVIPSTARDMNKGAQGTSQPNSVPQQDSGSTGIKSVFKTPHEKTRYQRLPELLSQSVIAQPEAVEALSKAALRAKAGLTERDKTQGAFIFTGPTGVGKTELAKAFARVLRRPFIRFDMADCMESHAVSKLISTPPGYVGHDPNGGLLHKMVRANPNAVLLFDEAEKAHPSIYDVLLQIMDNAKLQTSAGESVDFSKTTLIFTTNAGAADATRPGIGFVKSDFNADAQDDALRRFFKPEFRNRLDGIIPFRPLDKDAMRLIVDKFIKQMNLNEFDARGITAEFSEAAKIWLADKGHDPAMGARPLKRLIGTQVKDPLVEEILFGALEKGGHVVFDVGPDQKSLVHHVRESASSPVSPSVH